MFGLYIHIPYCLQKCHYCDFVTFDVNHPINEDSYTNLLLSEINTYAGAVPHRRLTSIYFGGGTPSLMSLSNLSRIFEQISRHGFILDQDIEVTIEINPGTVDESKLKQYLALGINRFSVGVQTFNDRFLKNCGREHSADESRELLSLLSEYNCNYSFDLLFGQPHQDLDDLLIDLNELGKFSPPHVSPYNLTVPKNHSFNKYRLDDHTQAEMFSLISTELKKFGIFRYELSNFGKPGFESRHNMLYWSDQPYWGIGVSAHSYFPHLGTWGTRFWNSSSASKYRSDIEAMAESKALNILKGKNTHQYEVLKINEAITDFCHTSLRTLKGLNLERLAEKFGAEIVPLIHIRLENLHNRELLTKEGSAFRLSESGWPLANQVFLELTFLHNELPDHLTSLSQL